MEGISCIVWELRVHRRKKQKPQAQRANYNKTQQGDLRGCARGSVRAGVAAKRKGLQTGLCMCRPGGEARAACGGDMPVAGASALLSRGRKEGLASSDSLRRHARLRWSLPCALFICTCSSPSQPVVDMQANNLTHCKCST